MSDSECNTKKQMVLFFIICTSSSMQGTKIGAVNTAIRELLPELKDTAGVDVDLKVACLTFSTGCKWMYPIPINSENFQWTNVEADGKHDLGAACSELNNKLSKDGFLMPPPHSVAPVIVLMNDGKATDDFDSELKFLKQNKWFKYAIKVAVAIGDDANKNELAEFTGNIESVVTVHTPEALKKWIRKVELEDFDENW